MFFHISISSMRPLYSFCAKSTACFLPRSRRKRNFATSIILQKYPFPAFLDRSVGPFSDLPSSPGIFPCGIFIIRNLHLRTLFSEELKKFVRKRPVLQPLPVCQAAQPLSEVHRKPVQLLLSMKRKMPMPGWRSMPLWTRN